MTIDPDKTLVPLVIQCENCLGAGVFPHPFWLEKLESFPRFVYLGEADLFLADRRAMGVHDPPHGRSCRRCGGEGSEPTRIRLSDLILLMQDQEEEEAA